MGFYLRKSLRFGPLRFNLSKSGVGVSAGVKGFRIGTGPRGNYIHAGVGGLYYRATLPSAGSANRRPASRIRSQPGEFLSPPSAASSPLTEIESGAAALMTNESSDSLLAEINAKRKIWRFWPLCAAAAVLMLGVSAADTERHGVSGFPGFALIIVAIVAWFWDRSRKTTVLFYDLQPPVLGVCEELHRGFELLASCRKIWHIEAHGRVADRKYHAGADTTVRRSAIALTVKSPPHIKTNVAVACIPVGLQQLYFFPDHILFYDASGVGAISYHDLDLSTEPSKFIESEGVPSDAKVIDQTWKYVNKKGGPDRRFKDNIELPIVLYEELNLRSSGGLNEKLQLSRVGASASLQSAVKGMAAALNQVTSVDIRTPARSMPHVLFPTTPESRDITTPPPELPTAERRCFYYFSTAVQGPCSLAELSELYATGPITDETLICSDDDQTWRPYGETIGNKS